MGEHIGSPLLKKGGGHPGRDRIAVCRSFGSRPPQLFPSSESLLAEREAQYQQRRHCAFFAAFVKNGFSNSREREKPWLFSRFSAQESFHGQAVYFNSLPGELGGIEFIAGICEPGIGGPDVGEADDDDGIELRLATPGICKG